MTNSRTTEQRISAWLEEEAVNHLPDRVLRATFEQTRELRQVRPSRWAMFPTLRSVAMFAATGAAAVVLVVFGLAFFKALPATGPGPAATATTTAPPPTPTVTATPTVPPTESADPSSTPSPSPSLDPSDPRARFVGVWISTSDRDGGTQTMTVEAALDASVDIVVTDTVASVCEGGPSTMTGTGEAGDNNLVIPTPDYRCDDGSKPKPVSGNVPVSQLLRNMTFTVQADPNELRVGPDSVWRRVTPVDSSPHPSATANSSPHSPAPGQTTFISDVHGIALDYPSDWETRHASEVWTGSELSFDSPEADVMYDPAYGERLYLLIASQPYGELTADEWRDSVLAWTCPDFAGGETWGWHVDGVYSWQQGPCNSGTIIQGADRGYLIRLVAPDKKPDLTATYNWDWLVPVLQTVDLRPEDAL